MIPTRRRVLATAASTGLIGLTGCLGVFGGSDDEDSGASLTTIDESISPEGVPTTRQAHVTPENTSYVTSAPISNDYEEAWTLDVFRGQSITDDSPGVGNMTTTGSLNGDTALFMNGENNMSGYSLDRGEESTYKELGVQEGVQPAIGAGNVFVAGEINTASYSGFAGMVDGETYDTQWGVEFVSVPTTPVTFSSPYMLVGDENGFLHSVPATGEPSDSWTRNAGAFSESSSSGGNETRDSNATGNVTTTPTTSNTGESRGALQYSIAADDSQAYAVTADRVWCHELSDGSGNWVADASNTITGSPVAGPNRVYIPTESGVTTYSKSSGEVLQDVELGRVVSVAMSPYGVIVFTSGDAEQIQVFGGEDDGVTYRASITREITAAPTIAGSIAYIPTGSGVVAYNLATQTTAWSYPTESPVKYSVTTDGSRVLVPVAGVLRCLRESGAGESSSE